MLLAELKKQLSITALLHIPFYSVLACEQFKQKQSFPNRKTEIFKKLVVCLMQRYASQHRCLQHSQSCPQRPSKALSTALQCHSKETRNIKVQIGHFGDSGFAQFVPGMMCCKGLEVIDFRLCDLISVSMASLKSIIRSNTHTLKILSVGNNQEIGDAGLAALADGIL